MLVKILESREGNSFTNLLAGCGGKGEVDLSPKQLVLPLNDHSK